MTADQEAAIVTALQQIAVNTAASAAAIAVIQTEMQMLANRAGMLSSAVSTTPASEPWSVHGRAKARVS